MKIDVDTLNDIQETTEWYESQVKGLGLRYKSQTKKQITSLKKDPYLFSIKYNELDVGKLKSSLF